MQVWKKSPYITLLAIIGVVYFFLQYIVPLVSPILVAVLFVTMFGTRLKKIQDKLHVHRQIGAVILLLLIGGVILLLLWCLLTWIVSSLPEWLGGLDGLWESLLDSVEQLCDMGSRLTGMDTEYLEEMLLKQIQEGADYLENHALPGILSGSLQYVKVIASVIGFLLVFIIATIFLAKDYDSIMNKMLNRQECHIALEAICGIIRYIATVVKANLLIMSLIGSICALGLSLLRIPGSIFWGILIGFLDALPFIGTGAVLGPLAILHFFSGYYVTGIFVVGIYVVCIFTREFLEPKLIGGKIGLPPLAVLTTVYAGIQLFGIAGIIKGPLGFILVQQAYNGLQKQGFWNEEEGEQEGESS